jgi:hypothetical protein
MNLPNNAVKEMLANVPDPQLRSMYGNIANGQIAAVVRCMSETCKGNIIAHITAAGRVEETPPVANKTLRNAATKAQAVYKSGLEGHRQRLDGEWGFRCYCGNVSVLAPEEKGVITPARPSESDLVKIADRLGKRKGDPYAWKNGKKEVDGFVIEEMKV